MNDRRPISVAKSRFHLLRGPSCLAPTVLLALMFFHASSQVQAQNVAEPQIASIATDNMRVSAQALIKLRAKTEGTWHVKWNNDLGVPRMLYGAKTVPYGADREAAAKAFLNENADIFIPRMDAAMRDDNSEFDLLSIKSVRGGSRIEFRQTLSGIPVHHSSVVMMMDPDGRVLHVSNTARPLRGVDTTPANTIEQIDAIFRVQTKVMDASVSMKHHELVIHPGPPARLSYRVIYIMGAMEEPWEYVLDARTGETLGATRLVKEDTRASVTAPKSNSAGATSPISPPVKNGEPIAVYRVHVDLKTGASTVRQIPERATRTKTASARPPGSAEKSAIAGSTEHQARPGAGKAQRLSPPSDKIVPIRQEVQ